jgi:hypothetical protein
MLKRMEKNKIPQLSPNMTRKRAIATKILLAQRARVVVTKTCSEVVKAWQNAVRVLRIMIFLHSAEDLSCVLRLYGIEQEP